MQLPFSHPPPQPGVLLSVLVGALANGARYILSRRPQQGTASFTTLALRAVYVVSLALVPLFFHMSTADAVIGLGKPLWDEQILHMDTTMMGKYGVLMPCFKIGGTHVCVCLHTRPFPFLWTVTGAGEASVG